MFATDVFHEPMKYGLREYVECILKHQEQYSFLHCEHLLYGPLKTFFRRL